ncbi:MAG: hypothetical protein ABSD64_07245 [Terriglobales bacterium]
MEVGKSNGGGMQPMVPQAHSISAQQVVKAAHEELLQLMRQRAEIMKRIGTVKQTISGLANLFGEHVLGDDLLEIDRPQAQWAAAGLYQGVPEGADGSAASTWGARGMRGAGASRAGNPGAAQGPAGLGDDGFESSGGLWRGPQPEQRARAAGVGVDQRERAGGGRNVCQENGLRGVGSRKLQVPPFRLRSGSG